jgi:Flp pilus assembly protein TadD
MARPTDSRTTARLRGFIVVALVLSVAVLAVYWPVHGYPFVFFDDGEYVYENPFVRRGLTGEAIAWAFRSFYAQNWHPLAWLSHMLDVQLFGVDAGAHHAVNVVIHVANALLVFAVLTRLTALPWRSAIVSALFALHPLRVESVAWISERKDVLSCFFGLLAIWAYARYVARASWARYLAVAALFAASLMAKPMLLTLPFVLLLLDVWPLRRIGPAEEDASAAARPVPHVSLRTALLEKLPLLALTAASAVVTYHAQNSGGAVVRFPALPLGVRVGNALVSYVRYVSKTVWPQGLCAYYPHPAAGPPAWQVAGAALLLVGVTVATVALAGRARYLAVGWLWFLGALVPVIGLVQVGAQSMADRYTYFPGIGLLVALVWGAAEHVPSRARRWVAALGVAATAALAVTAALQVRTWQSSEALFGRALAVTTDNWMAHTILGRSRLQRGDTEGAIREFAEARRIQPGAPAASTNLGTALASGGREPEALAVFQEAVRIDPSYQNGWYNLGVFFVRAARPVDAVAALREATRLDPEDPRAQFQLGLALDQLGRKEEAIGRYREALCISPSSVEAHTALAVGLAGQGKMGEALSHFREAARLEPGNPVVRENLETAMRASAVPAR